MCNPSSLKGLTDFKYCITIHDRGALYLAGQK